MLNLASINYLDYKEACLKFRKDSKEWCNLEPNYFYTNSGSEWIESSDNSHGGFDVAWTFHIDKTKIEARCREEYIKLIKKDIVCTLDNDSVKEWSKQEMTQYLQWLAVALT